MAHFAEALPMSKLIVIAKTMKPTIKGTPSIFIASRALAPLMARIGPKLLQLKVSKHLSGKEYKDDIASHRSHRITQYIPEIFG